MRFVVVVVLPFKREGLAGRPHKRGRLRYILCVGRYYRGFLQTAEEMMMLQLEDIFLAEPVLVPVLVHSKTGLLGEEPGLDGSLLVEECRSGGGLGQPYSSQSRFLCKMTIVYTHKIKKGNK